ncbi:hypothetical protein BHQ18_08755 [Mycolicibacterium flavescens]|uniref:DUF4352 domain-containing protein n=2 Tax=Mycolicibacterium flavescens TaxID=1776 RepID=A0A1E3RN39_MYCFV|nr:hypothetical protein BHQ18_08755 [Mycolicibacterium flavescens]
MLLVLAGAVVYGVFINDPAPASQTAAVAKPATAGGWGEPPADPTTEAVGVSAAAVDGPLAFTVADVDVGTMVSSTEAPLRKDAVGEFVVVRLSVMNVSDAPARFLGVLQTLVADGTSFTVDEEATFYVDGGSVEIPAGAEAQVGVAFDVPHGTTPEVIELRADAASPGVQISLS